MELKERKGRWGRVPGASSLAASAVPAPNFLEGEGAVRRGNGRRMEEN